jgi:hypothetical protein
MQFCSNSFVLIVCTLSAQSLCWDTEHMLYLYPWPPTWYGLDISVLICKHTLHFQQMIANLRNIIGQHHHLFTTHH